MIVFCSQFTHGVLCEKGYGITDRRGNGEGGWGVGVWEVMLLTFIDYIQLMDTKILNYMRKIQYW